MAPDKEQTERGLALCSTLRRNLSYQLKDGAHSRIDCCRKCGRQTRDGIVCPFCLVTECATALYENL